MTLITLLIGLRMVTGIQHQKKPIKKLPISRQRKGKSLWYVIIYTAHLERYFAITWPVFSLIQVKFLKKPEVMRKK